MQGNRSRDTSPEMAVRRLLHRSGLRYRIRWSLPFDPRRRADIAFPRAKVAVFIDGCFWHGCPDHYVESRTNQAYWEQKIERNKARDAETDARLTALGWRALRFWEHEEPDSVVQAIRACLDVGE